MSAIQIPSPTPTSEQARKSSYPLPQGERRGSDDAQFNSSLLAGEDSEACSRSELAELGEGAGRRAGGRLLANAKRMRRNPTDAERALWRVLRARRLCKWKFRRQERLASYIVDFICFEARLIVEADGSQHVESAGDAVRDAFLNAQGFRILRFWNNDVLTNREGVLTAVLAALETPLPQGARGSQRQNCTSPLPSRERIAQLGRAAV